MRAIRGGEVISGEGKCYLGKREEWKVEDKEGADMVLIRG